MTSLGHVKWDPHLHIKAYPHVVDGVDGLKVSELLVCCISTYIWPAKGSPRTRLGEGLTTYSKDPSIVGNIT